MFYKPTKCKILKYFFQGNFSRNMAACQDLTELSLQDQKSFFSSFDTVLTDCDGVLWSGNTPIPGSVEMIHKFREMGKKVIYVTNNATRSRKEYVTKMEDLGFGGTYVSIYLCISSLRI